jgi:hypothetical protein
MNIRRFSLSLVSFTAIWLPLTILGCGKAGIARVTGTVLHRDGTPVVGARIIARCEENGKTANGQTGIDGHYELGTASVGDGIAAGDYYVIVVEDLGDEHNSRPPTIAAKYSKSATSGLKFSVGAGEKSVFDIKLDPK